MTGPEHYRAAEEAMKSADRWDNFDRWDMDQVERRARRANDLAEAQAHATLALVAATVVEQPILGTSAEHAADWSKAVHA